MSEVYIGPRPIDWEDVPAEVAVSASTLITDTPTTIISFRTKFGKPFFITGFGQAWDAGMDTFLAYSLLIDGNSHPKYHRLTVQIAAPEQLGYAPLPVAIETPQGALIEVVCVSTVAGNFAARVKGEYRDY